MAIKSKFGLTKLVSTAAENPDDLLLGAAVPKPVPATPAPVEQSVGERTRFTNTLPTEVFRQLHQLSFWSREDMSTILEEALLAHFEKNPDADKPLPEKERVKRKLPPYPGS